MTHNQKRAVEPSTFVRRRHVVRALVVGALVEVFGLIPALAAPPKPHEVFAHKYTAVYTGTGTKCDFSLTLAAPSFRTFVEFNVSSVPGSVQKDLIGGIHQGAVAVVVGASNAQSVRFESGPDGRVVLWVGGRSLRTGLLVAQARPMASLVEKGNNGLISLNDVDFRDGKEAYTPKIAESYIDTEEGYWLLWADAMTAELFNRVDFRDSASPDGLTIVDSERPVTISTDGGLKVGGGRPRVAFWKRVAGEKGAILRHVNFDMVSVDRQDVPAVEAVRRVFKWAPVMRLAAKSDPVAFRAFVRNLERVPAAVVSTPRLLIKRI
jgi:hypothetical protein